MGHVDRGERPLAVDAVQLGAHLVAQPGIEVGQRLVEQDQLRVGHQRAGQRDALLLAAGQLRRQPVEQLGALDHPRDLLDATAAQRVALTRRLQRVGQVAAHGQVRPQRVGLEHHADPALVRWHVDTPAGVEHGPGRRS